MEPGPELEMVARLLALFCIPARLKAMVSHAMEPAAEGKAGGRHFSCCTLAMLNVAPETILFSLFNQHVGDAKNEVALKQLDVNWPLHLRIGGTPRAFLTRRCR